MNEDDFIKKLGEYSKLQKEIMSELIDYLPTINKAVIACLLFKNFNFTNQIYFLKNFHEDYIFFATEPPNFLGRTLYLLSEQKFVPQSITNAYYQFFMNSIIKTPDDNIKVEYLKYVLKNKDQILSNLENNNKELSSIKSDCDEFCNNVIK